MKKILMLSATGLMMLSIPAIAGPHEGGDYDKGAKMEEMFNDADANNDGNITKEEYMNLVHAKAAEKFAEKDANSDGNVSKAEAEAYHEKKRADMKAKRDEMREKCLRSVIK